MITERTLKHRTDQKPTRGWVPCKWEGHQIKQQYHTREANGILGPDPPLDFKGIRRPPKPEVAGHQANETKDETPGNVDHIVNC